MFVTACTTMIANTLWPVLLNNQPHSTRNPRAPKSPRTITVGPYRPLYRIEGRCSPYHGTARTRLPPSAPNRCCSGSITYPDQPSSSPTAAARNTGTNSSIVVAGSSAWRWNCQPVATIRA
jgi:hypothetical protein